MKHKITSFVIAECKKSKKGKEVSPISTSKSAPHYFEKYVPSQFISSREEKVIDGKKIDLVIKTYHPNVILAEATIEVLDIFAKDILQIKNDLITLCYQSIYKNEARTDLAEEYTVYQVSQFEEDPNYFLEQKKEIIASLLKSEKLNLNDREIEYTLQNKIQYAKDDLFVADWDGAFIFDKEGDFGETVELIQIANYQLLRCRILDKDLDDKMQAIPNLILFEQKKWSIFPNKEITKEFKEIIQLRTNAIIQFEALDRDIKLIGDWYSARLYDLLSKKFRLEEWRKTTKDKLESLESMYTIASEDFGMSRKQRLELIEIWGFFILQIGWFALIILEFIYFTRK